MCYKYLLVFVGTSSGWVKAYLTRAETDPIVTKKLFQEIIPRFGLPLPLGYDNGLDFMAKISQNLTKVSNINWRSHCAHTPQNSGQTERTNRTLKESLTKLVLETGEKLDQPLPFVLLRA